MNVIHSDVIASMGAVSFLIFWVDPQFWTGVQAGYLSGWISRWSIAMAFSGIDF